MESKLENFYNSRIWKELKKSKLGKIIGYDILSAYTKSKKHMFINDDNSVCYDPKNIFDKMSDTVKDKLYSINKSDNYSIVKEGNFLLRKIGSSGATVIIPEIIDYSGINVDATFFGTNLVDISDYYICLKSNSGSYNYFKMTSGTNVGIYGTIIIKPTSDYFTVKLTSDNYTIYGLFIYSNSEYSNIFTLTEDISNSNLIPLIYSYTGTNLNAVLTGSEFTSDMTVYAIIEDSWGDNSYYPVNVGTTYSNYYFSLSAQYTSSTSFAVQLTNTTSYTISAIFVFSNSIFSNIIAL